MHWRRATQVGAGDVSALSADALGAPTLGEAAMDDHELFNALVAQHAQAVLGIAAAILGTADAEDAGQEAIVRAWRAWPMLREREAFRAWLLRITVNVCRDWQRGRFGTRRRLNQPLEEAEAALPLATLGADPGGSGHTAALDLRHAINQLEDDLRLVVVLRYYAGMDATEIGATLGVPPATIRTRLRRTLHLLRERLSGSRTDSAPRHPEGDTHA
jgi:RNA polymerase sigma-70 factor (ECF subfamily)